MSGIVAIDALAVVVSLVALGMVAGAARGALPTDVRVVLALLLGLLGFHSLDRFLDWAAITQALDPMQDQLRFLEPVLLIAFLHLLAQRGLVQQLDESRERFSDIINELDAIVWETTYPGFEFTFVSRRAERILGHPVEQWITEPEFWKSHIHEEDRDWAVNFCLTRTQQTRNHELEYRFLHRDGRIVWMHDIVTVCTDAHGQVNRLRGVMVDVTERRLSAERLEQLKFAVEHVSDAIYWIAPDGSFFDVNDAACRTLQRPREELVGMRVADIDPEVDEARWESLWRDLRREGSVTLVSRHLRADGTAIDVEILSTLLRRSGQEFACAVVRDIAERRRIERQREAFHRLSVRLTATETQGAIFRVMAEEAREIFGHDYMGVSLIDFAAGTLVQAYCEDTPEGAGGPEPMETTHVSQGTIEHFNRLYGPSHLINRAAGQAQPSDTTLQLVPAGISERKSASLMFAPIRWGGHLIGTLSVQSYTPDRYREEDLRLLETFAAQCAGALQRVRAEEERRAFHDLTIALTEVHDRQELIRVVTHQARRMFRHDYLGLDFIDRDTRDLRQVFAEDTPEGAAAPVPMDSGDASGLPHDQRQEFFSQPRLINRHGGAGNPFDPILAPAGDTTRKSASLMFAPIRWTGDLIGTISVQSYTPDRYRVEDLRLLETFAAQCAGTLQRVRAEEERREIEAQLQHAQKLESLGVMAGGIAHDFNNLLTGVLGNASLLLSEEIANPQTRESLQQIEIAAQRASDLCQQMLAYSGRGQFEILPLDLSHLVREMTNIISASITKKAHLELDLAEGLPPVRADVAQMQQVAMNLITNASDALGDDTGRIRVRTDTVHADAATLREMFLDATAHGGEMVLLEVEDTGAGMDEETLQRIFDPFFTTKFTGRGLGLAAVLGIVRGHRGAIDVQTAPGKGTLFRVLLPVCEGSAVAPARPAPALPVVAADGGQVLVVDDEETVRRFAKRCLERAGYGVHLAESGERALEMCGALCHEIDVVVLDLTMPGMSGIETLQRMQERRAEIPVILSSGYNQEEVSRLLGHTQVSAFLKKPYRPQELLGLVHRALAKPR